MIVQCDRCDTRFQLDDARIPEQGTRVRCSLCKHAFFVERPATSEQAAVEAVVAEAVQSESVRRLLILSTAGQREFTWPQKLSVAGVVTLAGVAERTGVGERKVSK